MASNESQIINLIQSFHEKCLFKAILHLFAFIHKIMYKLFLTLQLRGRSKSPLCLEAYGN